ncbi:MAG: methionyl-tRNA formyltransferase, partial [Candidatus Cryptobacteroides sp.]
APINWAVINGDNMTGVTTFMIDEGMDTGHIIMREQCRISETDTAGDIHDKLMEIGARTVLQTVDSIIDKDLELRLQKSFIQGSERLRPAPKLSRELCNIDWRDTSRHICNLIRGLSPYPAAFTELVHKQTGEKTQMKIFFGTAADGERLAALTAESAAAGKDFNAPGSIISDGKTYLAVRTSDGAVELTDIQLSGKKRMDVKTFLLGFRNPEDYTALNGTAAEEIAKTRI